jgi:F-type H+-transporting ATPase subunit epsilon
MASKFDITLVTPDGKKHLDQAEILNVVTTSGALGIMSRHLPLVAILEISHLNYKRDGQVFEYSIAGGIINVKDNSAQILAESFESKEEIDLERAENSKQRAEDRLASKDPNIDIKRAEIALKKAINRISLVK